MRVVTGIILTLFVIGGAIAGGPYDGIYRIYDGIVAGQAVTYETSPCHYTVHENGNGQLIVSELCAKRPSYSFTNNWFAFTGTRTGNTALLTTVMSPYDSPVGNTSGSQWQVRFRADETAILNFTKLCSNGSCVDITGEWVAVRRVW